MDIDNVLKGHGIGVGGSSIKSIQYGTLPGTSTTNITISSVDISKSIILFSPTGVEIATLGGNSGMSFTADLTSPTNLAFITNVNYSYPVNWWVIEFNNVKSIQRLTVTVLGTSNSSTNLDTTIAEVNVNKSIVVNNGSNYPTDSTFGRSALIRHTLTSPTNIRSTPYVTASYNRIGKCTIVEFN